MDDACHDFLILLGKLFLKTSRTKINVHRGRLTMKCNGEVVMFNICDVVRFLADVNYLCALDVIDEYCRMLIKSSG